MDTEASFLGVSHHLLCNPKVMWRGKPEGVWQLSLWLQELLPKPGNTKILLPYADFSLSAQQLHLSGLQICRNSSGWQCCLVVWTIPWADICLLLMHRVVSLEWAPGVSREKDTDANCRKLCPAMLGLIKGTLTKSLLGNTSLQSQCVGIQVA